MPLCLVTHTSIHPSIHPSIYSLNIILSICLCNVCTPVPTHLHYMCIDQVIPIFISTFRYCKYLPIHSSICPSIHQSVHPSIHSSTYLYPSIHSSICPYTHPSDKLAHILTPQSVIVSSPQCFVPPFLPFTHCLMVLFPPLLTCDVFYHLVELICHSEKPCISLCVLSRCLPPHPSPLSHPWATTTI